MLSIVHLVLTAARRVVRIHHTAKHEPLKHKPLLCGHILELAALALGTFDYTLAEHVTGVAGAAMLLFHVVTHEV